MSSCKSKSRPPAKRNLSFPVKAKHPATRLKQGYCTDSGLPGGRETGSSKRSLPSIFLDAGSGLKPIGFEIEQFLNMNQQRVEESAPCIKKNRGVFLHPDKAVHPENRMNAVLQPSFATIEFHGLGHVRVQVVDTGLI